MCCPREPRPIMPILPVGEVGLSRCESRRLSQRVGDWRLPRIR